MSDKHESKENRWQEPVFLDPDQIKTTDFTGQLEAKTHRSTAVINTEQSRSGTRQAFKKSSRWKRWLGIGVSTLTVAIVGSEIYRFISWGFELHTLVGISFSSLTLLAFAGVIYWLHNSLKGLRQLAKTDQLHQSSLALSQSQQHGNAQRFLNQLLKQYEQTPFNAEFREVIQQIDSAYNDQEIIRFVSERALTRQDAEARKCIKEFSIQSGLLVAVSPYATFDMLLVGWRNLKMLQQLAEIYGIAPGAATQWKLLTQVLHNIAFTGISELMIDAGSQALSTSITSQVSARASQGIGAGLFTLRTGQKAIALCRPLPLSLSEEKSLSVLSEDIVKSLLKDSGHKP